VTRPRPDFIGLSQGAGTIGPVKILHTSDWHVGRSIRGRSRAGEHREVLAEIAGIAASEEADLTLVAGDLFDVVAPSPESEQIVFRALLDLADVAPVVIVAGNHDHPRRLEAVAPLLELGRVRVGATLRRPDEGGVITIATESGETARLALVPFVSQRAIVSADDLMALDPDQHGGKYAGRLAAVIAKLTEDVSLDQVNLVVAHLMVAGGTLGGGERSAHTIFDYAVSAQAFDGSLSYVALGHLHRPQRVPAAPPVWYSGSPLQMDFGETEDRKAVLLVEAEPGLPARVRELPLRSGRRLLKIQGSLEQVAARIDDVGDAYLRVELDESPRVGLADEVRDLFPNAVDVTITQPDEQREDLPPVRLGRAPHELFVEYLVQKNIEDERLVALFDELLAESHET
jgi:exonuclease SbcD